MALARYLRRELTKAERIVWRWLRDRRFLDAKFRRQHAVGPYVLDFYSPELRLAIEVDGSAHNHPAHALQDRQRDRFLVESQIAVVRLANDLVMKQPTFAADQIRAAVELRRR